MTTRFQATIPFVIATLLASALLAAEPQQAAKPAPHTPQLPKAFAAVPGPDAEALLLSDRYTLRDDGSVVHERWQRIQVNSSLAINRELGESRVVWDPLLDAFDVLYNRTVLPSGKTVEGPANAIVDEQPPAVHGNPLWSHLRRKVIVHTALEPGAVIEDGWRVVTLPAGPVGIAIAEPLTYDFPIAQRRVELDVPATLEVFVPGATAGGATPECREEQGRRICLWSVDAVPALPGEAGTPARSDIDAFAIAAAGAQATAGWIGGELQRRWDAAGAAPAGALAAARKAADAEPDRERKLLASLTALSDAVNVSGDLRPSQTGWRLHPLDDVWAAGWASTLEMAALQARVLAELGFRALPVLVLSGPQAGRVAGFALHDRAAVLVRMAEGDDRLYDPRDPAADRPLELALANVHLVAPGGITDLAVSGAQWRRRLVVSLASDDKGGVKGDMALETAGAATPHAALVRDPQKLADRLAAGLLDGAKAKTVRVTRLARGSASVAASFEGTLPDRNAAGLVTVKLAGVPGGVGDELPPLPGTKRLSPIALPGPGEETLEVTLTLPKGWSVASLPSPVHSNGTAGALAVTAEKSADGSTVTIRRTLTIAQAIAPARDAAAVRELLAAWASPASRELLLRPPSGASAQP